MLRVGGLLTCPTCKKTYTLSEAQTSTCRICGSTMTYEPLENSKTNTFNLLLHNERRTKQDGFKS